MPAYAEAELRLRAGRYFGVQARIARITRMGEQRGRNGGFCRGFTRINADLVGEQSRRNSVKETEGRARRGQVSNFYF
jgi:hypothetical protein